MLKYLKRLSAIVCSFGIFSGFAAIPFSASSRIEIVQNSHNTENAAGSYLARSAGKSLGYLVILAHTTSSGSKKTRYYTIKRGGKTIAREVTESEIRGEIMADARSHM